MDRIAHNVHGDSKKGEFWHDLEVGKRGEGSLEVRAILSRIFPSTSTILSTDRDVDLSGSDLAVRTSHLTSLVQIKTLKDWDTIRQREPSTLLEYAQGYTSTEPSYPGWWSKPTSASHILVNHYHDTNRFTAYWYPSLMKIWESGLGMRMIESGCFELGSSPSFQDGRKWWSFYAIIPDRVLVDNGAVLMDSGFL